MTKCPRCGHVGKIVNQCGCDPNNMPTCPTLNPWTYRVKPRGNHGGQQVAFFFQGREFMRTGWYPPWRNEEQRVNAKQIVADLNQAFQARNAQ